MCHRRVQLDLGIDAETIEEICYAIEEVYERIITCTDAKGGLIWRDIRRTGMRRGQDMRTVRRISMPMKIAFVGWNGTWVESVRTESDEASPALPA